VNRIAVLQPSYLPWLGFFEQMMSVDTFVFYDDVQYTKNDWRNRNRIKTKEGFLWLTIPVKKSTGLQIREVRIDSSNQWQEKHRKTIAQLYSKAPHFEEVSALLEPLWNKKYEFLLDTVVDSITIITKYLNIETKIMYSSEIKVSGNKNEKLINICKTLGASEYYSGLAAQNYLDNELFKRDGINIAFQHYQHPLYPQMHGNFVSHLSIIDLLFNCGNKSRQMIKDY
jgi:hypothetical protein